jgi:hypothetical protein
MRKRKEKTKESHVAKAIRKMKISDGDVILIKEGSRYANVESIQEMGEMFEKHYPHIHCVFIVVDTWEDLKTADDEIMQAAGWLRWPRGKQKEQ